MGNLEKPWLQQERRSGAFGRTSLKQTSRRCEILLNRSRNWSPEVLVHWLSGILKPTSILCWRDRNLRNILRNIFISKCSKSSGGAKIKADEWLIAGKERI